MTRTSDLEDVLMDVLRHCNAPAPYNRERTQEEFRVAMIAAIDAWARSEHLRGIAKGGRYVKPVFDSSKRQPTHNYSVLGLITEGPLTIEGADGDAYWDIVAYIDGQWKVSVGSVDTDAEDVAVKVSHWTDLPWYPCDDDSPLGVEA